MLINKQDTNGTKPLLSKGELGYDDYSAGGDKGRVYVGSGTENIPLAKKSEHYLIDDIDTRLNALAPHSGLLLDRKDFYFNTTASYLCKVSVQDEYMKVGDKVVEMYGPELVTNFFSGWTSNGATVTYNTAFVTFTPIQNDGTAFKTISVTQNTDYIIEIDCLGETDSHSSVWIGTAPSISNISNISTTSLTVSKKIINSGSNSLLYINVHTGLIGNPYKLNNISVREVKTIDLNTTNDRAGFYGSTSNSFVPEVLVQDQAVNGLTVTSGVKKGDYVITKAEVLGNGGFDSDSIWSKSGGATISGGVGNLTGSSYTDDPYLRQDNIFIKQGTKYTITFDIVSLSNCNLWLHTNLGTIGTYNTTGTKTVEWTATEYNGIFFQTNVRTSGATCTIDNVKVISHQDTYRAIQDAPSGTSLPNTTYFQTRDYISNQVLTMLKADGTLYSEVLMTDVYAEDIGSDRVFTNNGWSKVGHGLWSKGSVVGTPIGIWQTLNKGAYHPWFNSYGSQYFQSVVAGNDEGREWYFPEGTISGTILKQASNIGDTFNPDYIITSRDYWSITDIWSGGSRPDTKYADIIYQDQWIDLRTYATKQNHNLDVLANKAVSAELSGISNEVGMVYAKASFNPLVDNSFGNVAIDVKTIAFLSGYTESTNFDDFNVTINCISKGSSSNWENNTVYKLTTLRKDASGHLYVMGQSYGILPSDIRTDMVLSVSITKQLPILSSKTKLSIDLIGNPQFYPQSLKDMLASGKTVVGINPLLVNQNGTTAIPQGIANQVVVGSRKALDDLPSPYTGNSGYTWVADSTVNFFSVGNSFVANYSVNNVFIVPYTSANPIFNTSTPLKVKQVGNKVIASNSHSIYKGNLLSDCGVQVGNGANGIESKVLENVTFNNNYDYTLTLSSTTLTQGKTYLIQKSVFPNEPKDGVYMWIAGSVTTTPTTSWLFYNDAKNYPSSSWQFTDATPKHNTLTLDTSVSKASKHFFSIVEDTDGNEYLGKFSMELINDGDWGDVTFPRLTNGTYAGENGTLKTSFGILPLGTKGE